MTDRRSDIAAFLRAAGWGDAMAQDLAGDASARRYLRLRRGAVSAVLMDSPLGGVDDPAQFIYIAHHLNSLGLSAPQCLAQDLSKGLLLLEDFGDDVMARVLAANPAQETPLYALATDVLVHLQHSPAPRGVPDLSASEWATAAMLCQTRYQAALGSGAVPDTGLKTALKAALSTHANGPRVLILRDYHAENLLYLPKRHSLARLGLLDFQLGQMGQPSYDLVSLLQDVRRDVPPALETAMIARYLAQTGADPQAFSVQYAVIGVQRALRILGNFAQLCTHQGKPNYLPLLPRVWAQLQRNLAHPRLQDLAQACHDALSPPSADVLTHLKSQCKKQA